MSRETIIVADDETYTREVIADAVRSLGHECWTASTGLEALEMLKKNGSEIIISDICMPELDGLKLIDRARQIKPGISVIIITGYVSSYPYHSVIAAGANDLINKPFTVAEVTYKLERILNERRLSVQNRRLAERQAVLNRKMLAVLQVSQDIMAEHDSDRLFETIIHKVTQIMEAERSSLYLIDWKNKELWTKVAEQVEIIRLPLGYGISGRVAENGETVNVEDAWDLPYFDRSFDLKHGYRTRSVLCMPVSSRHQERVGVLQVLNKRIAPRFDQHDEEILTALAAHVAIAFENSFLLDELHKSFESSVRTLSAMVDARHPLTAGHSQRVTEYALVIGREIGLGTGEMEVLKYAALLHDIGKIAISDLILLKHGAFTPEERAEMNTHPVRTRCILENFLFPRHLADVPTVASHHHERVDGSGYPYGLTGEEIPLNSRILALADVFDALTSHRDYDKYCGNETLTRDPMPLNKVVDLVKNDAGSHFDPDVVEAFLRCLPNLLTKTI